MAIGDYRDGWILRKVITILVFQESDKKPNLLIESIEATYKVRILREDSNIQVDILSYFRRWKYNIFLSSFREKELLDTLSCPCFRLKSCVDYTVFAATKIRLHVYLKSLHIYKV